MVRTRKFGNLEPIGVLDVKKIGGYEKLENLLITNNIDYETDSISARFYSGFGGGQIFLSDKNYVIISTYSRLVNPRFINIRSLYVYKLYIINKDDFDKIKNKLPIKQY